MNVTKPFYAVSMTDYAAKKAVLEEAVCYNLRLQYQAAAAAIIGAFATYPDLEEIAFTNDGTRDSNVDGYELRADSQKAQEQLPEEIAELNQLLWWFFDDEDTRATLSQSVFHRSHVVEELYRFIGAEVIPHWDVNWDTFVNEVYAAYGQPQAWAEAKAKKEAQALADPRLEALFDSLQGKGWWETALAAAPEDAWRARKELKWVNDERVAWSPLACAAFLLLNRKDYTDYHPLRVYLDRVKDPLFIKLAGPVYQEDEVAPQNLDVLAMIWVATQRGAFASNSYSREVSADAFCAWGGTDINDLDARALFLCADLSRVANTSSVINHAAVYRMREFVDGVWKVWRCSTKARDQHDGYSYQGILALSEAMVYCGGKPRSMSDWYVPGVALGERGLTATLNGIDPDLGLRFGLATLVHESRPEHIAVAEQWLMQILDQGGALAANDEALDDLLAGKGVTDVIRQRVRDTVRPDQGDDASTQGNHGINSPAAITGQ